MPSLKILSQNTGKVVNVVGVTGKAPIHVSWEGQEIPFLPLEKIEEGYTDIMIVCGMNYHDNFNEICRDIYQSVSFQLKIILDRIICMKGFSLEKHLELISSQISIISLNCFGGLVSHLLTLPFNSPFINLYTEEDKFLDMLEADPRESLQGELEFERFETNSYEKHDYPVFSLNGLPLYFLHYQPEIEVAKKTWQRRVKRINWYNLFVTMYTDSEEALKRFSVLPFAKKVCFVPFETDIACAYPVLGEQYEKLPLHDRVNYIGWGFRNTYNLWDMLLYGKKTCL